MHDSEIVRSMLEPVIAATANPVKTAIKESFLGKSGRRRMPKFQQTQNKNKIQEQKQGGSNDDEEEDEEGGEDDNKQDTEFSNNEDDTESKDTDDEDGTDESETDENITNTDKDKLGIEENAPPPTKKSFFENKIASGAITAGGDIKTAK